MQVTINPTTGYKFSPGALLAALALAACGGDPSGPETLYTLGVQGGDTQSAPAGSVLATPLQVLVRDPVGTPVKGVTVRFRVTNGRAGAAQLTDSLAVTGGDGIARAQLRVGAERDTAVVTAAVPGQEGRGVTFRAVATAGASLAAVAPTRFAPGDTITIRGSRLTGTLADNQVLFGTVRGRVVGVVGDSLLRVVVPPCLGTGNVPVLVRLGSAQTNAITATVSGLGAPLRLAAYEAVTVRASDPASCLVLPAGSRHIFIPHFLGAEGPPTPSPYVIGLDSVLGQRALQVTDVGAAPALRELFQPAARPRFRDELERFLRAEEGRTARSAHVGDGRGGPPRPSLSRVAAQVPEPPALGSTRAFRVLSTLATPSAFASVTARLRYAGRNVLVYEDQAAPEPLADDVARRVGDHFDQTLYTIDVATFGAESDVDGNGRVIVLMTPVVNGLTPSNRCAVDGFAPGFFYSIDFDRNDRNSNRGEIFYAFVPDTRGQRSCSHSLNEVLRLLPPTFLHEFQHMISYNQHVLVRGGSEESAWLNEGLSHVAEELGARYYERRFPAPTGRTVPTQLLPDSALPFIRGNLDNGGLWLANTATSSVTAFVGFGTLQERGAAWLFLRWLASQKGEGAFSRLVQTSRTSRRNVEDVAGETFGSLFGDFGVALYADSVPGVARSRIPARYRFAGPSLRELYARVDSRGRYPLNVRAGVSALGTAVTGGMVQGTFDFFDFTIPRTQDAAVRFTSLGGASFPAGFEAQLAVLRLTP